MARAIASASGRTLPSDWVRVRVRVRMRVRARARVRVRVRELDGRQVRLS